MPVAVTREPVINVGLDRASHWVANRPSPTPAITAPTDASNRGLEEAADGLASPWSSGV